MAVLVAPALAWPSGPGPGGLRQLGEVAATPPMQEGAASESSPRYANVVQTLGTSPFLKSLLADRQEHSTAALPFLTHGKHPPLAVVAGGVEAERAPMMLPRPRQKRPSGVVGSDCPLAKGDRRLLRLGGEAQKCMAQGELGYAEVLFEELEEILVYAVVAGGAVRWGCARLCGGHEAIPSWSGSREVLAPRGHSFVRHPNGNITVPIVQQLR